MSSYTGSDYRNDEEDDSTSLVREETPRQRRRRSDGDGADVSQPTLSNPYSNQYPPWLVPRHQPRGNFWEQIDASEQQAGKSLVPGRRPWAPNIGQPYDLGSKRLEGPAATAADPVVAAGGDHGVKADPEPPRSTYFPHTRPVAAGEPDKGPPGELFGKREIPGAATTRVDLVHDPSRANKDMSISIALDAEEDWDDDLEEFCRLRRLGLIKEAKEQFWSALGHVNTMPYIRVQYAEMLQTSGDFKGFQDLDVLPEFPPGPAEETPDDRNRGKLVANHALLDLLSQRPTDDYLTSAWRLVRRTLKALATESTVGSTEIQLIVLCLRVLDYLKTCTHETVVGPAIVYASRLFNWRKLYHDLVGESCVWDFKDLFFASVSTFGWQETLVQFFETAYFPRALDSIIQDWTRPFYDEASSMGLLDLFTSLILKDHGNNMKARNTLLLHHAKTMAESAEHNDPELMKTRPFVQWLLAKSVIEMGDPPERPDGVRMEHFNGLKLNQGGGVNLPIYVPSRHTRKPDWDMFFSRSTPAQRRVVEVAVRAAEQLGDYNLQAEALKLLILQSQDPKQWMAALAQLQLETQGDKEGYLTTCLSRYLIATDPAEEATLLKDLEKPGGPGNALYFEQCENASLTWAWSMVRVLLTTAHGDDSSIATGATEPSPFLTQGFSLDGSKLPPYVAEFARVELGMLVSESMSPLSLADLDSTSAALNGPAGLDGDPATADHAPLLLVPVPPSAPPPWDPWNYYNDQQPNPLAQGVTPALEVKGWPKTWYEDAKQYGPSIPQRLVESTELESDSDDWDSNITGRNRRISVPSPGSGLEAGRRVFSKPQKSRFIQTFWERDRSRERDWLRFKEEERMDKRLGDDKKLSGIRLERWRGEKETYEGARGRAVVEDGSNDAKRERNGVKTAQKTTFSKGNGGQKTRGWRTPPAPPPRSLHNPHFTSEFRDRQEEESISTELDSRDGGYVSGEPDGSGQGMRITMKDGVTKLYFPSSHPDGSGTTMVFNGKHQRRSNVRVVGKDGSHVSVAGKDSDSETIAPHRIRRPRPDRRKSESITRTVPIAMGSSSESGIGRGWYKSKKEKQVRFNERQKSPYAAEVKTEDEADRQEEREYGETDPLTPPPPPPPPPTSSEPKPGPELANAVVNDTQPPTTKEEKSQTATATAITAVQAGASTLPVAAAESRPKPATKLAAEPATEPTAEPEAPLPPTITWTEPATAPAEPTATATTQQTEPEDPWADFWTANAASKKKKSRGTRSKAKLKPKLATADDDDDMLWAPFYKDSGSNKQPAQDPNNETAAELPAPETEPQPIPASDPGASTTAAQQQQPATVTGWDTAANASGWGSTWDWGWPTDTAASAWERMPAVGDGDVTAVVDEGAEVVDERAESELVVGEGKSGEIVKMIQEEGVQEGEAGRVEEGERARVEELVRQEESLLEEEESLQEEDKLEELRREEKRRQEERRGEERREEERWEGVRRETESLREKLSREEERVLKKAGTRREESTPVRERIREQEEAGGWFDELGRPFSETLVGDAGEVDQQG
ncbi:hypothetical protein CHGG_05910 [Chaetomium globosum CBS 148.51]|uniref:Uncharacterized protein n=1 Tax=Chaetomium globosum (strain ATCC 6205 / CBS 148.51 / DSM 1962 / NBRC 6347 / NRRL 1970) TaxID=306901 RepID=Q2H605_CHAGB|nr:uncharacterized protein CHGG_05910 [Chaetomium globosum CBS 148.51]EAQ89291.1 hypothetical protein CHGG_05910 [Chaetomium globosum CBS 148.51]